MRFRYLSLLLLGVAATAGAQSPTPASPPPDLSNAKKDLASVRTAQELWYTNHNAYSSNLDVLDYKTAGGVKLKLLNYNQNAYSVSATVGDDKTASCVMYIGNVAEIPKTAGGRQAKAEGGVICDGDPLLELAPAVRR
jgi:hypothetical protein